jgi:uncharacterized protein YdhG (YjbR/CyaY superfamily)
MKKFATVDEYISSFEDGVQEVLRTLQRTIREAAPQAEESLSYQMVAYRLNGAPLFYFAAWKQHYSLYPATDDLLAAFADDLAPYQVEKSTIRFPYGHPVPVALIAAMTAFRAAAPTG